MTTIRRENNEQHLYFDGKIRNEKKIKKKTKIQLNQLPFFVTTQLFIHF